MVATMLLMFGFAFAVLAVVGVTIPRVHFGWLAIAFWILSGLLAGMHAFAMMEGPD